MSPLVRFALRVPVAEREQVVARLLELAPQGFEEVDHGDDVELAVYADEPRAAELRHALGALDAVPVAAGWEDSWRSFHRPVRVGGLWIGPPWLAAPAGVDAVVIDPGRAFGTGGHATTRLCIGLLAGSRRGSLLDVGCGSGVLALAALRLGFGPVVAVDCDPVAVVVAAENAAVNGVVLDARVADATVDTLSSTDVVVANVSLDVVERLLARLDANVFVTSGYLEHEVPAHPGWLRAETATREGWSADRFERR